MKYRIADRRIYQHGERKISARRQAPPQKGLHVAKLKKCMTERAKILPRRVTGTCAFHQRELTTAIKRARHIALLPYVSD